MNNIIERTKDELRDIDIFTLFTGLSLALAFIPNTVKVFFPITIGIFLIEVYRGRIKFNISMIQILIFFWMIWSSISVIYTVNKGYAISELVKVIIFASFFILVTMKEFNKKEVNFIMNMIILGGVVTSFFVLFSNPVYFGNELRYTMTIKGVVIDPNFIAKTYCLPSLILFYKMFFSKNKSNILANTIMFLITSYTVLITGSRGGVICLLGSIFIGAMYIIWLKKKEIKSAIKSKKFYWCIAIVIIIFALVLLFLPEEIYGRIFNYNETYNYSESNVSYSPRFLIWGNGIKAIKMSPIFGHGFGSFLFINRYMFDFNMIMHNNYLMVWAETGIIGFLLFFTGIFVEAIKNIKLNKLYSLSFLVLPLISGFFLDALKEPFFWTSLTIAFILINNNLNKDNNIFCDDKDSKKKILFLIDALTGGGAERVFIDLVNSLNKDKYNITVMVLADVGQFKKQLGSHIKYKYVSKNKLVYLVVMVLNSKMLYKLFIQEKYDVEVAFLEGRSTKVIAGSNNRESKKIAWVHTNLILFHWTKKNFISNKQEQECYKKFNSIVCVSNAVKESFIQMFDIKDTVITQYNPIDGDEIIKKSFMEIEDYKFQDCFNIIAIGRLTKGKAFDRLIEVARILKHDGYKFNIAILGEGPEEKKLGALIEKYELHEYVKLLGFKENPYKYIKNSDLLVMSSKNEGLSTVVIEGLILHVPVVTTDCPGMKEILGDSEYGLIVNQSVDGILKGIKNVVDDKELYSLYKQKAAERSEYFKLDNTMKQIESMFEV